MRARILLFCARAYRWLALAWAGRIEVYHNKVAKLQAAATEAAAKSADCIAKSDDAFVDYKLLRRSEYESELAKAAESFDAQQDALRAAMQDNRNRYTLVCDKTKAKLEALANEIL